MKFSFKNIFAPIVLFFFMLSACEVSTQYFTNTFDDEYDYYVQPDNSLTTFITVKIITDFVLPLIPVANEITKVELLSPSIRKGIDINLYPPPLFLKNHIFLI